MQVHEEEWQLLLALRERFLDPRGPGGRTGDYWTDERLCELYDATYGRRIAWKWRAVWGELRLRGRLPLARTVLDWGCGSGIAAREHAAVAGPRDGPPRRYHLFDRSTAAAEFAAHGLRREQPGAQVETRLPAPDEPLDLLLASHVLGELDGAGREELLGWARRARAIVWVEPGERTVSRALMELRDRLLEGRVVLGPCTHSESCGLGRAGRERDWCHSFAAPAPEVFTRADWREFSRRLGIDLRSVPYAYFALATRGAAEPAVDEPGAIRILGRPRLEKGHAKIDACDASGVRVLRVLERDAKAFVKDLAEPAKLARTFRATVEGDRVRTIG
jgi:hypothetical protein